MKAIIFDLDQTLVDSKRVKKFRDTRQWSKVYQLIPTLKLYPHIQEILSFLNKENIKIAIVTTSPSVYAKKIINHFNINTDVIVAYHDTVKRKPDPEPMLFALTKLGTKPKNTLSVGDRAIDIIASNDSKVLSGACLWDSDEEQLLLSAGPDYVFRNPKELLNFLKHWGTE